MTTVDPTLAPTPYDFQKREAAIKQRQAMLAQLMRQQQTTPNMPQGQMVSGHYVAPSWSQNLAAALQPFMGRMAIDREQQGLEADTAEYNAADRRAAIEHAMSRPQGTPAQFTLPDDQAGPSIPAQQPTTQEMTAWAQSGANIPSRKDVVAKIMEDLEVKAPIRQEDQAFKDKELQARLAETRYGTDALNATRKAQVEATHDLEAQRRIDAAERAKDSALTRQLILQGQIAAAGAREAAAGAKAFKLSDKARADLDAFEASNNGLANAITALDKASDKGTGWVAGVVSNTVPGGASLVNKYRDKATNDAIQQTTYWTDEIRHGRFGTALTATEKA